MPNICNGGGIDFVCKGHAEVCYTFVTLADDVLKSPFYRSFFRYKFIQVPSSALNILDESLEFTGLRAFLFLKVITFMCDRERLFLPKIVRFDTSTVRFDTFRDFLF